MSFTRSLREAELVTVESSHSTPLALVKGAFVESCGALSSTGSLREAVSVTLESYFASFVLLKGNLVKSCKALPSCSIADFWQASLRPSERFGVSLQFPTLTECQ